LNQETSLARKATVQLALNCEFYPIELALTAALKTEKAIVAYLPMVSTCANPACGTTLRRLQNGRLFHFEVRQQDLNGTTPQTRNAEALHASEEPNHDKLEKPKPNNGSPSVAHFWLCGKCSKAFTLTFAPKTGVKLMPLYSAKRVGSSH
jgi:hypothetical protein